jgi:hypothetical protein
LYDLEPGSLDCECEFSRKYLLPCKHIFQIDIFGDEDILTDEVWDTYVQIFQDC